MLWSRPGSHIVDVSILWMRPRSHIVDFAFLWIRPRSWFGGTSYKFFLPCGPAASAFFPAKKAILENLDMKYLRKHVFYPPLWARAGPGPTPPIPLLPSYASLVCSTYWPLSLL